MSLIEIFNTHRPLLFGIAYRMLGSVADAEDVLQDANLKWERASAAEVRSPRDYRSRGALRSECRREVARVGYRGR